MQHNISDTQTKAFIIQHSSFIIYKSSFVIRHSSSFLWNTNWNFHPKSCSTTKLTHFNYKLHYFLFASRCILNACHYPRSLLLLASLNPPFSTWKLEDGYRVASNLPTHVNTYYGKPLSKNLTFPLNARIGCYTGWEECKKVNMFFPLARSLNIVVWQGKRPNNIWDPYRVVVYRVCQTTERFIFLEELKGLRKKFKTKNCHL